ncbi:MAG: hypothetical protein PUA63_09205 [Oscillospiraceae bacterium]|nr:hypothetical protein [Oscillospiraceae bacterium]
MESEKFYREVLGAQSQDLIDWAVQNTVRRSTLRGEVIFRAGEMQDILWFLVSGVYRAYRMDAKTGKEVTVCFDKLPGSPLAGNNDISKPCFNTMDTVIEGELIGIPVEKILEHIKVDAELARIYNNLLVRGANIRFEYSVAVGHGTATERYNWFCREFPGLIEQVNNRYIASYLGMTPVTLSRLRHDVATKETRKKKETVSKK